MSSRAWRMAAAVAVVALLAAGLVWVLYAPDSSDGGEPVPVDSTTPTASAEATDSPAAEGTFAPTDEPEPELETTGEDFDRIWRSINEYVNWLYSHPDPDKLDRVYSPKCRCYETEKGLLATYEQRGLWWTGAPTRVLDVQVLEHSSDDLVQLIVSEERSGPIELINSSGGVIERFPAMRWQYKYVLSREGPESPWRELTFNEISSEELS